jgi:hypothetical protein
VWFDVRKGSLQACARIARLWAAWQRDGLPFFFTQLFNHPRSAGMSDPLALNLVPFNTEPSLAFDAFDLDLVLKVLNNTAFSEFSSCLCITTPTVPHTAELASAAGPFFTFFVPVLLLSQGQGLDKTPVFWSSTWFAVVTAFCSWSRLLWCSKLLKLYRYRDSSNVFRCVEKRLES